MRLLRRNGDIWATPPGGSVEGGRGRGAMRPIAFGLAVTVVLGGALAYSEMRASTAVSGEDVLAEFQAATAERDEPDPAASRTRPAAKKRREPAAAGRTRRAGERQRAPLAAASENREQAPGELETHTESRGRARQRGASGTASPTRTRPKEGVYAWQVEGYEQAPGVRRQLPSRSHRVIRHDGATAWVEHHIFSEEKEQWMNLALRPDGVIATSVRNRVVMGPVEEDSTVVYNPPVFVARLPNEVGRTWKGSWEGRTSGSYTGRTFDHTTVVIQGEEIEVWASEVVMTMRGELEGRATTRSWYSPKYSMVVKQYQIVDIESGPGSYRSEWTGQVLSVTPQT